MIPRMEQLLIQGPSLNFKLFSFDTFLCDANTWSAIALSQESLLGNLAIIIDYLSHQTLSDSCKNSYQVLIQIKKYCDAIKELQKSLSVQPRSTSFGQLSTELVNHNSWSKSRVDSIIDWIECLFGSIPLMPYLTEEFRSQQHQLRECARLQNSVPKSYEERLKEILDAPDKPQRRKYFPLRDDDDDDDYIRGIRNKR